jgi:hypothetical protein
MDRISKKSIQSNNDDKTKTTTTETTTSTPKLKLKPKNRANTRAIAGGVTTIALIALGVVVAGAVGAYAFTSIGQNKAGLKGDVVDVKLVRSGTAAATLSAVVKNVGDVSITTASISLQGGPTGSSVTISNIAPGQTMSGSVNIASGITAPGTVYTVLATFTGQGGQTMTDTFNVTVEGV